MKKILMPEATAVWLLNHTALTFYQIATFCDLPLISVEFLADGKKAWVQEEDPIKNYQLTWEEIQASTADPQRPLKGRSLSVFENPKKNKKRYVSLNKRQNRPHGILWFVREHPYVSDRKICQLLGTTKPTIAAIRNKTHRYYETFLPQDPVLLGLCSRRDLQETLEEEKKRQPAPQPQEA